MNKNNALNLFQKIQGVMMINPGGRYQGYKNPSSPRPQREGEKAVSRI